MIYSGEGKPTGWIRTLPGLVRSTISPWIIPNGKLIAACAISLFVIFTGMGTANGQATISSATQECLDCHASIHPGIVQSWKGSRHAATTPEEAIAVQGLARKVSSQSIPDDLKKFAIGCAECHTLNSDSHSDSFDHNGYSVHVVVTPKDCNTCHTEEASQFDKNIMAHAYDNLAANPSYQLLTHSMNATPVVEGGTITLKPGNAATDAESCFYCHGTRLTVEGTRSRETDQGTMEFPIISGWPNAGVGRLNPDGSRGACSACHTRHAFSLEAARKPSACKECHSGPDVPAMKVYDASKHGGIYSAKGAGWNYGSVPWKVGEDFTAPTCAACHMSLLVGPDGNILSQRTHEIKDRLPWRIFGLIYAHPHPTDPSTVKIRNADGLHLPTDFKGGLAKDFLLSEDGMSTARENMQASCTGCHSSTWIDGHWGRFMNSIQQTNEATLTATRLIESAWATGAAKGHAKGENPFDEFPEKLWSNSWLLYSNTIRFSAAMAGGGDYSVFADGRYQLMRSIAELQDWLDGRKVR